MGILDTVKTIDEYEDRFKGIFYGSYGSGKTTLASTFPTPIWLDFEKSTETLRNIGKGSIKAERPVNMKRAEQVVEAAIEPKSGFDTIVIDTLNSMQSKQLGEHMMALHKAGKRPDVDMPMQFDYRKSTNQLSRIVQLLQDSDKHVVLLCQERFVYEKDSDPPKLLAIRPDVTSRLAELIGQMLNVVARLELKPGIGTQPAKRILHLNPTGKIVAKNRLGIQQNTLENPTFESIFELRNHNNGN